MPDSDIPGAAGGPERKGLCNHPAGRPLTPSLRSNREGVEVVAAAVEKAGYKLARKFLSGWMPRLPSCMKTENTS